MKSAAKNIQLASYDDLFKTDEERQADAQERVQSLPLDKLEPFPNHPFKVIDDDKMLETVESIKERGVLVPILVRPKNDGNFEIVSGHRRHHASLLAGLTEIPAIVREMDDDTLPQPSAKPPSSITVSPTNATRSRSFTPMLTRVW